MFVAILLKGFLIVSLLATFIHKVELYRFGDSLHCYRCVSSQPGCGDNFDWRWHWAHTCPGGKNDKCVKIVERKGADVLITRECLSNIEGYRRDIPADRYEGCRPAARDYKNAHYTFNEIKELDVKRDYFDETTFCFCDFDYFCNGATTSSIRWTVVTITMLFSVLATYLV